MSIDDCDVIKSVERVFEIFEWFDQWRAPASATTVARALEYPVSSTSSLLKSMMSHGYLSFDPIARDYFPTLRLTHEGAWMERDWFGAGPMSRLLDDLRAVTGETVTVSCQNDMEMLFVRVNTPKHSVAMMEAGRQAPLFRSAVGFSALSCRSDRDVRSLVQRFNRRTYRPGAKADVESVLAQVRRVRATGYAVGYDLYVDDVGAIAWALQPERGHHMVVISVGGPSSRLRGEERAIINAGRDLIKRFVTAAATAH